MEYELTSTGREENQKMPIFVLGLSQDTIDLLRAYKFRGRRLEGKFLRTVGDLVASGKDDFENYVIAHKNHLAANKIIYDIESKLARIGLKIDGSDFTAGDIKIEDFAMSDQARKAVEKLGDQIKTIGDLTLYNKRKLAKRFGFLGVEAPAFVDDIEDALEVYGLKLEESKRKLNPEKVFSTKFITDKYKFADPDWSPEAGDEK